MEVNCFQYTPLDLPSEQIRLLHIHPGPPDAPIQCTLAIAPLKPLPPPPYVAVSYTWGPPTPTATVTLDGRAMVVRQSCADALRTMRLHRDGDELPVWIDAVCINQADAREKSVQVAMMGAIYHGAASVAACLRWSGGGNPLVAMRDLYPLVAGATLEQNSDSVFERWQAAVHSVLRNAYFTRMWIVQEIGLARELRLFGGDAVLSWSELETQAYDWRGRMMSLGRYPTSASPEAPDPERALKELADTRTEMGTHERIYAMLPMLQHAGGFDAHRIQPDYGRSPWEVLWACVCTIRFPAEPERRRNAISTGFELWTGLRTFEKLVDCFNVPHGDVASFLLARASPVGRQAAVAQLPRPPDYLEKHFMGYAMRICCPGSNAHAALIRHTPALSESLPPSRHFLAVWPGLPAAAFTVEASPMPGDPEAFTLCGYYPCRGEVEALRRMPPTCDCRRPSCPAKRSKRDIHIHPEDLLAMVLLTRDAPDRAIESFTAAHTRSFVRLWEPAQQTANRPDPSVSAVLASLGRAILPTRRA